MLLSVLGFKNLIDHPASEASWEVGNLTERKNPPTRIAECKNWYTIWYEIIADIESH